LTAKSIRDSDFERQKFCSLEMNSQISGQLRLPNACAFLHCPATFQFMHWNIFLAQAAAPAAGQSQQPAWLGFAPMILLVVVFYFILIRPQQKRAKEQAKLITALKSGDKVVTSSGIIGVVITVKDTTVSLRSADAKMEVTKASVTQIIEGSAAVEA
jgi:preprotein translocase subunit YajC